ncbi:phage GP46 family protein [Acidocella sp.]|uniref:phage GP46 family protein n=1 Tax=Acidocella sp. TaxID=50710 RepID=UPI002626F6C1|nr:phage GP46 family protein [Acidocella sp.]
MADLALVWNNAVLRADLAVSRGDIALDRGLQTAIIVSLFTDAPALPGDILPDHAGPRGWWGNAYLSRPIGSRLWLLRRAVITQDTLTAAQDYAREALQWLIDDGVAGSIGVTATQIGLNAINLAITLNQQGGSPVFNLVWSAQGAGGIA